MPGSVGIAYNLSVRGALAGQGAPWLVRDRHTPQTVLTKRIFYWREGWKKGGGEGVPEETERVGSKSLPAWLF